MKTRLIMKSCFSILLGTTVNVMAQAAQSPEVAKFSNSFSALSSKSEDGLDVAMVFSAFDHDVPKDQRSTVLASILGDDPQKDGAKDWAVIKYLSEKDASELEWGTNLEAKVYARESSPSQPVRSALLYLLAKCRPKDHATIVKFLKDPSDAIRAQAVDVIGDWPDEGKSILSAYYKENKANEAYVNSSNRAKARMGD